MTAASSRFRSVCDVDLDKVLNDGRFILKQLDYSLSISMHDSCRGRSLSQSTLTHRNQEQLIYYKSNII